MARQNLTTRKKSTKTGQNSNQISELNRNKLPFVVQYKSKHQNLDKFTRENFKLYSLSESKEFKARYAKGTELLYKMLKDNKYNTNNSNKLKTKKSTNKKANNSGASIEGEMEEGPQMKGVYSTNQQHHQVLIKPPGSNTVKKIKLILKPPTLN